ncbi:MAG: winged helix DNA-binding domain-containing protein [Natronospirillum sp.]|uniref:DNA glycosylase AlkZ-like family protein n=1 Tax=Natronospirillum sp. TaxID=2812955 RepID=UPI0025D7A8BE|nr:crosslink repair DNA glycosylase YcaQ family protein [Natronospirillum sp.]MCH8552904.1 winged helix DNA-binding domain-containing protein [Natronospirillum sp.]
MPLPLDPTTARRLLTRYQFRQAALPDIIQRLGTIQYDPLSPMGKNPDLVLQARVPGYRVDDWQRAAYRDRLLLDGWDKQASLFQPDAWWAQAPFHDWFAQRWRAHGVDVDGDEAQALLQEVADRGPATSLELGGQQSDPSLRGTWYGPKRSRHLLKALWDSGRLVTRHRVAGRHAYDLPERVLPEAVKATPGTEPEALRHLILRRVQAVGLLRPKADAAVWLLPCKRKQRDQVAAEAVRDGELAEVDIEGERYWATPAALALLDSSSDEAVTADAAVRFLAPLDPLMWDRTAVARLFGFDYVWEVYKPVRERRWGYYVLPVQWGDRFVARFDGRCQNGELTILAWHWEADINPKQLPDGLPEALTHAARQFMQYLGADRVHLPRGMGQEARQAWQTAKRGL